MNGTSWKWRWLDKRSTQHEPGARSLQQWAPYTERSGSLGFPDQRLVGLPPDRVQSQSGVATGEIGAVAGVQIALRRQPFGEDHCVGVQLNMIIGDLRHMLLTDRRAVHQMAHRDQNAISEYRVVGREQKIAGRLRIAECPRTNANRQHLLGASMTGDLDAAMADPADRPGGGHRG